MEDIVVTSFEKEDSEHFSHVWNNYVIFEKFYRHKGDSLGEFVSDWKEKMALAQYAGCQYSDILLACKLLDKSNLEEEDLQAVINSIAYSRSEVLSILLSRLEHFSPEETERDESQRNFKEEKHQGHEVKKESSSASQPLFITVGQHDRMEPSRCPNCEAELDLVSQSDGPDLETKKRTLICKSCDYEIHISNVVTQEPDNMIQDDDMIDAEIKEEILEHPQSSLEFDIDDLVIDEEKSEVSSSKKPKARPPYEETKIHNCNVCGKRYDRIRLVIAHMTKVHGMEGSELADYEEKLKRKPRKGRTKKKPKEDSAIEENDEINNVPIDDNFAEDLVGKAESGGNAKDVPKRPGGGAWGGQCEFCGRKLTRKGVQKHYEYCPSRLQAEGSLQEEDRQEKKSNKKKRIEKFQCEFCGKECPILSRLKEHYARCPNLDQEQREAKGYMRKYDKATCNICGKVLHREHNLRLHMTLHGEKNYKCDLCPAAFTHALFLFYHKKRHEERKRYHCSECPKSFTCEIGLKRHIMREHTNERPYKCTQCNYSTVDKSHLQRHIRSHTGETPFKCSLCGKLYRDKKSVKRHMKAHHGQTDVSSANIINSELPSFMDVKLKGENQS